MAWLTDLTFPLSVPRLMGIDGSGVEKKDEAGSQVAADLDRPPAPLGVPSALRMDLAAWAAASLSRGLRSRATVGAEKRKCGGGDHGGLFLGDGQEVGRKVRRNSTKGFGGAIFRMPMMTN